MENITKWRPKHKYRKLTDQEKSKKRDKYGIIAVGNSIPSIISSFRSMRLPKTFRKALKSEKIKKPFALQRQGLPAVLLGRDTLIISISREGKTLIFCLPLIISSIQEELRLPFAENEGPLGLIIVPSRELANQIFTFLKDFLHNLKGYPKINICLCAGGISMQDQLETLQKGVHIVISTPGRLSDLLNKSKINLKLLRILVLDEADRLLDLGFDEEVRTVLSHTSFNMQIILSSSTLPKRMQEFASNFMKSPVYISSSRNEIKKLQITHTCEIVINEGKLLKLLGSLMKTEPPILIFCENKTENDSIQEFLSLRKIDCASLHGGKMQNLRSKAINDFNKGNIKVLIATDMAAKGLSFEKVKHVINYDLPKDIDAYMQRVCRGSKKASVTSFVSYKNDKRFLKDLAEFVEEIGGEMPEFMQEIRGEVESKCEFCSMRGHKKFSCLLLQMEMLKSELPLQR